MDNNNQLWYSKPAKGWTEALPIGNGRLGGMVFGGVHGEKIQLNEDSVWSGGYRNRNNQDALANMGKIRGFLAEGKIRLAEETARLALTATPEFQRVYQTLGDFNIGFKNMPGEITGYKRGLDLETAVVFTEFTAGGFLYRREVFASAPANVIAVKMTTDNPDGISFNARLLRDRFCERTGRNERGYIFMDGAGGGADGISFSAAAAGANTGGEMNATGEYLVFRNAREVSLFITAATSFREKDPRSACEKVLAAALDKGFEKIRREHIEDYSRYENRTTLRLDGGTANGNAALPTDERLLRFAEDPSDLGLIALYFRFGRYLMIAGSREGSLPLNLQGIWCQDIRPPWDSKYTININTEMNYWPAESCGLSELHTPLFDLISRMHPRGVETAKEMYGARGFTAHHNTDIWGDTAPQDTYIPSTYWVMGAAWLCLHIWEHYQYTLDEDFLRGHFFLLRDAALFFADFLIEDSQGRLIASPTVSPENTYRLPNGETGAVCAGCTMDSMILLELFNAVIGAAEVLKNRDEFLQTVKAMRDKLPQTKISPRGTIQEWTEDYEETEPGHRHISHLFGLFPGNSVSCEGTPELARAARKTLEYRLANGGGHTGWSRAWITNFWAKLGDGERVSENVNLLLTKSTHSNLFDNHPPFQIDGNFGGTAGIINSLVWSEPEKIYLLYALPPAWKNGKVTGVRVKGGASVDLEWADGKITAAVVRAGQKGYAGKIIYNRKEFELNIPAGEARNVRVM